jgi:alkanesulfonate monooxygenase SsuD/methylene tetrahydromethanopterin reductase-like flavin-dependent oxidoreductase (luciferase family)
MEFSCMTEPQLGGTYDELLALARWSESNGLHSFARSDHYYSGRDPKPDATDAFATLAGLARETETIRLAVLVSPITFRHPAVIAKNAATIDQMSGGRLDLGVGTGWMEEEHAAFGLPFPDDTERWERFEESLDYLEAAFGEGHGTFSGKHYSIDATAQPKPTGLRLIIGGSGPRRTPTLAGERADEYNCLIRPADEIGARIRVMRDAAGDRPVAATVMGPALVGRTEQEYRDRLEAAAARRDISPEEIEQRYVDAGIPVGTPARAAETIAALDEAGVERWYVQWLEPEDPDGFATTIEALRGG